MSTPRSIRLTDDLVKRINKLCKQTKRTFAQQISFILECHLNELDLLIEEGNFRQELNKIKDK